MGDGGGEAEAFGEGETMSGRAKATRIPAPLERQEQAAFVRWLELAVGPCGYFHVPNEGKRGRVGGAIAKGQGLRKGVPDLVITRRPPLRPEVRGIAVEMKRRHGSVTSEEQKAWIAALREDGWAATVAEGWDEARRFVESFGFSTERRFEGRTIRPGV